MDKKLLLKQEPYQLNNSAKSEKEMHGGMCMPRQPMERENSNQRKYLLEKLSSRLFLFCALLSVISLLLIVGFVFYKEHSRL